MKLDRNTRSDGRGKYRLIRNRQLDNLPSEQQSEAISAIATLMTLGLIEDGSDFFVLKYADQFAAHGLLHYATMCWAHAWDTDNESLMEFAKEVKREASRAKLMGVKLPD